MKPTTTRKPVRGRCQVCGRATRSGCRLLCAAHARTSAQQVAVRERPVPLTPATLPQPFSARFSGAIAALLNVLIALAYLLVMHQSLFQLLAPWYNGVLVTLSWLVQGVIFFLALREGKRFWLLVLCPRKERAR